MAHTPARDTPDIRSGDKPGELRVFDHGFVRLDAAMADDLSVVNGARVSFAVRREHMDERDKGLIRFLMRERHGCFDDATEVLTDGGWKAWPDVIGDEHFATLSPTGSLEYQRALLVVHKEHRGPMVGFEGNGIDQMVTADHRVLVARPQMLSETTPAPFMLLPARDVVWMSQRHASCAQWTGTARETFFFDGVSFPSRPFLRLTGFFIACGEHGRGSGSLQFRLADERKLWLLRRTTSDLKLPLEEAGDTYSVHLPPQAREHFVRCYGRDGDKVVPRELFGLDAPLLAALLEGLMEFGASNDLSYPTASKALADAVQELALKTGRSASVHPQPKNGRVPTAPRWTVTIRDAHASRPALCEARADADNHMGIERFNGTVHCATVPNGTLYIRRNGHPVFSGNSPFEHNAFRFHIRAPIFVAREWMRHRFSSFNEESARYHQLEPDFYLPEESAVRTQVGRPGAYSFEPTEEAVARETIATLRRVYDQLYATYQALIDQGVAKELARAVLPFGIYTQFYWTVNARSLMNFLSLRNSDNAQFEIRTYAEAVERLFADKMPITHECFQEFGRMVP
jgi:thymidylate synthase (FAD)